MCATKQSKVLWTEVPWFKISSTEQGFCAGQGCFSQKIWRYPVFGEPQCTWIKGQTSRHLHLLPHARPNFARAMSTGWSRKGLQFLSLHEVFRAQRSHHTMSIYTMYIIYRIQYVYYVCICIYIYVCVCIYLSIYVYTFMCVQGFYCLSKVGWNIHSNGMTLWHVFQQIWWLVVRVCFPMKLPALTSFPNNGKMLSRYSTIATLKDAG